MAGMVSDLKLVIRQLRKSPGFTVTSVLMLAFGIGATTAIFSIVDGVLLRPLPFTHSEQLVTLGDQVSGTNWGIHDPGRVTGPEVITYPRDTHAFSALGGYGFENYELSRVGQQAVEIHAARMTSAVFEALGVPPMLGRVFTHEEDIQKQQVVVLSYATWKSRFNGSPYVLGNKIELDRKPYIVIGVMPRDFEFPLVRGQLGRCELWVPMSFSEQEIASEASSTWYLRLVGRLKPNVTVAQAQDDAQRVAAQIMHDFPPNVANFRIRPVVYPLQEITVVEVKPILVILLLAVGMVLLIACANLAGLLLIRAIGRQREMAVRMAIGASAWRLVRQLMLESLIVSATGGLAGVGIAAGAVSLGKSLLPETLPLIEKITLNWRVAGFAVVLAILTGLLCGLAPGCAALRTNVNAALKEGGRSGSAGENHTRLRSILVAAEIAIAFVLLTASGLLLRSFGNMNNVDLGFRPDHVTIAEYALPQKEYPTQTRIDGFNDRLLQQIRQLPSVGTVGLTSTLPITGGKMWAFVADGYADSHGSERTVASPSQVNGDYFKAIGIPLIRGRYFTEADNENAQLVVIVNREFATHYWPAQDPIGKRIRVGTLNSQTPWMTVVGEVADAKLSSPDGDATDQFYQPVAQIERDLGEFARPTDLNGNFGYMVVRAAIPPERIENGLRATVLSIDQQLPLSQVQSMEQVVSNSEAPRRFNTAIISCFALAAVMLAMLGIYSIIAFSVTSRVQEMAIRLALGSQRADIVRLVLFSGLKMAAVGCVLGMAGSVATSQLLRSFLFQVNPVDPIIMLISAVAIFLLALAASALPAQKAALVHPLEALREG